MKRTMAAAAVLLCATFAAHAQTLATVKERGVMRLGYSETSVPFAFKTREGTPGGYSVEICERVAAAVALATGVFNLKVEWVALTPAERLDAVASGRVDVECGTTTVTFARREKVDFSIPIFVDASTILARSSSAKVLTELQGKKVAAAQGTTSLPALEAGLAKRFVKAEIVRTKTVAEGFELLRDGKVDALASDRTVLVGTFLQGGGAEGLTLFGEDLSYEPYALVVRKGDSEFRLLVDRAIAQLYRSGDIEGVYQRWLAPLGKPTPGLISLYLLNSLRD